MKKQITALILAAAMILTAFTGCAAGGPGNGTTASTTVATTAPEGTTSAGKEQSTAPATTEATEKETVNTTAPEETTAPEAASTAPEDTDSDPAPSSEDTQKDPTPTSTEPPATDPPSTEPPATDPPETEPPATTEASHNHSYSAVSTVAPSCDEAGYTVYECSCGSSYTDDETSATGHSWSDWTVTKEATSSAEGEQARTCSACDATETAAIEKLPAVQIDTAALEEYGRQYGEANYDFVAEIGTRAGYYPGWTVYIDSMEKGRSEVAECVDATANQLLAAHGTTYCYLDIEVVHEGGNQYCIWVYYG